ncbi:hypothetical protein CW304_24050 [Bacillus sp. UFRGS-B20]|nr:hypothetical protein CW304_24050 [Bacillus sp. UFRGS-B20]
MGKIERWHPFSDVVTVNLCGWCKKDYFVKLTRKIKGNNGRNYGVHPAYIDPELVKAFFLTYGSCEGIAYL